MSKNDTPVTARVQHLREHYLNHSPMSTNRDLVAWKCHRSLYYYVEGWMHESHAATVRLRRAGAEGYMLRCIAPVIEPGELIVGQPDFTPFSEEEQQKYDQYCRFEWNVIPPKRGRADHLGPDFTLLLEKGIIGMLALLNEKADALDLSDGENVQKWEYYNCCRIELEGLLDLAERYAAHADALAEEAEGDTKRELRELAAVLHQVPAHPARTFREALQSVQLFKYSLFGLYSFGHIDRWLLTYYRRDIEAGILTPETAQELVDCFMLMSVPNMSAWAAEGLMLGGREADGTPVENELTWHFLTAIAHTHIPDPNVGFCVTRDTSPEILHYAAELITAGHAQPQIWNSDAVTASMLQNGFEADAANNFTLSTCVEVTPVGMSGISITSPYINLLQIFLDSLKACPSDADFETIFDHFRKGFGEHVKKAILIENLFQLERGRNYHDPARVSVLIHDCIERGRSHDDSGARYNHLEPNILGMSNVIESLNVLQELIYRRGRLTLDEFRQALADNYEGHEALLSEIRQRVVHFGNDTPETNAMAKKVTDMVLDTFKPMKTVRGAHIVPGAFSYREHEIQGRKTPASPDGRVAGQPLNDASCPVQGYDVSGPTASLLSTASWEPSRFLGGTSVNVKLPRNISPERVAGIIRGYLETKGAQLQFNVYNVEELHDAKVHPERHRDLLVRIGGYSDFFVKLPESLQNEVISRTHNEN